MRNKFHAVLCDVYILFRAVKVHVFPPSSPSLDKASIVLERLTWQRFGEIIRPLVFGVDFEELEFVGVFPEPVVLVEEISSSVGDSVGGCQEEGSLVVFEYSGSDGGVDGSTLRRMLIEVVIDPEMGRSLNQHSFQREHRLQGV